MKLFGAKSEISDASRLKTARITRVSVREPRRAGSATHAEFGKWRATDPLAGELSQAIEAKKRDNLVLGETLVSFGLLQRHEMSEVQNAQARSNDVVGSLMVASAIRSRLGDILLQAKRITSAQLEHALTARVRVEQAIGVLAERHRLRPRQAFDLLRNVARSGGQKVNEIAEAVVDSTSNPLLPLPEELARKQLAPRTRGRSPRHAARSGENVGGSR